MGESRLTHAVLPCEPLLALDESHATTEVDAEQGDWVLREHADMQTCRHVDLSRRVFDARQ